MPGAASPRPGIPARGLGCHATLAGRHAGDLTPFARREVNDDTIVWELESRRCHGLHWLRERTLLGNPRAGVWGPAGQAQNQDVRVGWCSQKSGLSVR